MSRWMRYAHQNVAPIVKMGAYVKRGDVIGYSGSSGFSTAPHLHFEVMVEKPLSWFYYPVNVPLSAVKTMYEDPTKWLKDDIPVLSNRRGYGFLEWAYTEHCYHPGIDLVVPKGTPIKSVCNGRVQFTDGKHWIKNILGKIIPSSWNHGFGNFCWIEVDESNPGI